MDKYLGIDYGSKRTGVAISDEEGRIAFPREVLPTGPGLAETISDLCRKEKVEAIVLGQSLDYKNAPNPIQSAIENWKLKIENLTGLPVYYQSELWTSAEASRNTAKKDLDASAAALILQAYLDKHKS
ncbi:MAG TPA: RuvX/YqgF family protein [Candidatus Paceibacterota bacterium]